MACWWRTRPLRPIRPSHRPPPDDRCDGQVRAAGGGDVRAPVARRRYSPSAARDRGVQEGRRDPRGRPFSLDLVKELNVWRGAQASVDEFVFATVTGRPRDKDSVRERVLVPVVDRANEVRGARDGGAAESDAACAPPHVHSAGSSRPARRCPTSWTRSAMRTRRRRWRSTPRSRSASRARTCTPPLTSW